SAPTAPALEKDIPEVERAVRVEGGNATLLSVGDKKLIKRGSVVDTGFFQMFSFSMLKGNPATALHDIHSIVITQKTAKSLFGDQDPIGKIIKLDDKYNFTVTGVLKDLPANTSFEFDYLLPWASIKKPAGTDLGWNDNSTPTYVMLKPGANINAAALKISVLRQRYSDEAKNMKWELFLYPLKRWHLYSNFTKGVEDSGGQSTFVKLFGIIAAFIILIACINFMNLSTARSEKRAKEVGIRKVAGAQRSALVVQFIGESVFLAFLAGIIAIIIVLLSLPAYNQLTHKTLFINFSNVYTWLVFVGFILFTGLLAGSYPAFFLSSFKPVKILKGTFKKADALITPRKILVIVQFTFAIMLIICTIVVKQQIDYARNRDTGYDSNNLVWHSMTGYIPKNYALIKNELLSSGIATSVTKTNSPITQVRSNGWGQEWEGKNPDDKTSFDRFLTDDGLSKTAGLHFLQGRDFDLKKFPTDSTGLIINESSLKLMKFKNPIGMIVKDLGIKWHIVGVVKDFILTNPYEPIRPILITGPTETYMKFTIMHIKLNNKNSIADNLKRAEVIFKKYNPEYPFEFRFVDDAYAEKFNSQQLQGTLAALFAGLTIFISCLGLFGLAAYMAESRIKEIGVRKVLGASVTRITTLLSKDFLVLIIISFLIASPIAYWGMSKWLMDYTYRINMSWGAFALAGFLSLIIATATISYQSIKAALTNPVKSLRSE
ncbi:MAG: FtsX-like permease family protein, partial [Mucilaginibacter sp.]